MKTMYNEIGRNNTFQYTVLKENFAAVKRKPLPLLILSRVVQ